MVSSSTFSLTGLPLTFQKASYQSVWNLCLCNKNLIIFSTGEAHVKTRSVGSTLLPMKGQLTLESKLCTEEDPFVQLQCLRPTQLQYKQAKEHSNCISVCIEQYFLYQQ